MKKVQHNLKIAKNVAKRVQDLKEQVTVDQQQLQSLPNVDEVDKTLPFKKDQQESNHKNVGHIPSVQDSSTGSRHSSEIMGNLVATKAQNMEVQSSHSKVKAHSKKYRQNIQSAKNKMKEAEESMKKMDQEVKDFHAHMQAEVAQLMLSLTSGSAAIDQTKKDEQEFLSSKK